MDEYGLKKRRHLLSGGNTKPEDILGQSAMEGMGRGDAVTMTVKETGLHCLFTKQGKKVSYPKRYIIKYLESKKTQRSMSEMKFK